ncbi:MAG TPA: DoxX family protein [Solirubrobacterales bacterium]|jgi:putative oxidoreductase|nr:DoxX family protein [Solirubrobacterales bacterium]
MKFGRLLARLIIGGMFIGHGTQKWFGWFGGPGIEKTTGMMDSLGLAPARANAHAASASETLGGVGIALGAFTPLAAASLIGTMVTAIRTVHWEKGFWAQAGGYEYNLTIIAALLLIVDGGPGALSVDSALGIEETGPGVALAALAAGAIGSTVALAAAKAAAQKAAAEAPTSATPADASAA